MQDVVKEKKYEEALIEKALKGPNYE